LKPFLLLTLLPADVALANPKPVRVVLDSPTPEDAPHVEGCNLYEVTITPPLKPADYAVKFVSPLPPAYTITAATPGRQTIVRAWNSTWGESPVTRSS
jgi:hypothetical protein